MLKVAPSLTPEEQQEFFHLAEGSELLPLSWFLALETKDSSKGAIKMFANDLERFGLIPDPDPDPNDPHLKGLPIGITAAPTVDARFLGKMVGVNCAACHVAELQTSEGRILLLGAPNLFDIEGFYRDLASAVTATVSDTGKFARFASRVLTSDNEPAFRLQNLQPDDARRLLESDALYATVLDKAQERSLDDLMIGFRRRGADEPPVNEVDDFAILEPNRVFDDESSIVDLDPETTHEILPLPPGERRVVFGYARRLKKIIELLYARADLLRRIAQSDANGVDPGPGRVDAFGTARNILFPESERSKDAPISFPHLWGLASLDWLHWDGNTNSILERNVGQALGLGAVVTSDTRDSTVDIANIHRLEELARKIEPPNWPFGELDEDLVAAGEKVYEAACSQCHSTGPRSGYLADALGVDRARGAAFAVPLKNGEEYALTLGNVLRKVVRAAGETQPSESTWRTTKMYFARPLAGAWATAPYLHNNSVPTIADLLKPASERPVKFWVGSREYDTESLGYKSVQTAADPLDTQLAGNRNTGHEYGVDLSEPDKRALLEYLKSI